MNKTELTVSHAGRTSSVGEEPKEVLEDGRSSRSVVRNVCPNVQSSVQCVFLSRATVIQLSRVA
jgi:hypothetical protein